MKGRTEANTGNAPGAKWLRIAVIGSLLMAVGSLVIVWVHIQTREDIREVLTGTEGLIRTDGQMHVLNEVMTRGLLLSVGGLGLVLLGIFFSVLGLVCFFRVRRRCPENKAAEGGEAINAP